MADPRTNFHEAGHAVLALKFKLGLLYVTNIPALIPYAVGSSIIKSDDHPGFWPDLDAVEAELATHGGKVRYTSSEGHISHTSSLNALLCKTSLDVDDYLELQRHLMTILAGPIAEKLHVLIEQEKLSLVDFIDLSLRGTASDVEEVVDLVLPLISHDEFRSGEVVDPNTDTYKIQAILFRLCEADVQQDRELQRAVRRTVFAIAASWLNVMKIASVVRAQGYIETEELLARDRLDKTIDSVNNGLLWAVEVRA